MIEAFNILKVKVGTEFVVTEAQWRRLAKVVAPHISGPHLELLLRISDEGQKGHVGKKAWPLTFLLAVFRAGNSWGTWGAQSVEHPTLDFGSGHDPRVVGLSPASGSALSVDLL